MQIFDMLQRHGVCVTVAAIPAHQGPQGPMSLDKTNVAHLIAAHQSGIIEIAQHGFSHASHGRPIAIGENSEFAAVSVPEQRFMIENGKRILEEVFGTPIRGFVPPWNTYDQGTLVALEGAGFSYLSAGWEYSEHHPKLISVPRTCQIAELPRAVKLAKKYAGHNPYIVAVMHHYDIKEDDCPGEAISLGSLENIFARLGDESDVQCKTLSKIADEMASDAQGWLASHRNRAKLPYALRKYVPREMLMRRGFLPTLTNALISAATWG